MDKALSAALADFSKRLGPWKRYEEIREVEGRIRAHVEDVRSIELNSNNDAWAQLVIVHVDNAKKKLRLHLKKCKELPWLQFGNSSGLL